MIRLSEDLLIRETDVVRVTRLDRGWPCKVEVAYRPDPDPRSTPRTVIIPTVNATQWEDLTTKLTTVDMRE